MLEDAPGTQVKDRLSEVKKELTARSVSKNKAV